MDRLAGMLADMVRSALTWEQEHGVPPHGDRKIEPQNPLTIISLTDTLKARENAGEGEHDDHQD